MGSKRDKRRKARKRAEAEKPKQPRVETPPREEKSVRAAEAPSDTKEVRTREDPYAYRKEHPAWRIRSMDRGGPWKITDDDFVSEIRPKLHEFESMTWNEIEAATTGGRHRRKAHHEMLVSSLPQEAHDRLDAIRLYEDILFRFRLGGTKRLWGVRDQHIFRLVWYDPDHMVYPTEL